MAAAIRVCCALRVTAGGKAALQTIGGSAQVAHLASRASVTSLHRNSAFPPTPVTAWQQTRHGSFFNKLTADQLWKGMLAESGSGAKKGRGKRAKRRLKKDLNRGQDLGEGRGGYLWPGLNTLLAKQGDIQQVSRRGRAEQEERAAALATKREEWERFKKIKIKRERGWTGSSWGGVSLGAPDPGPNGESYEDFDTRVIEVKSVFSMTAKEGRRRSISCLVVVGNGNGAAGFALGKGPERNTALRKAKNRAMNYLHFIERYEDHTIYHDIESNFKKTTLRMKKKNRGYGLHCHRAVITICKLIGIQDMYCKVDGSVNLLNMTKALFSGLANQETHQALSDKKKLHVVEFRPQCGPLPIVVASPCEGVRADPEPEDDVPNTRLHWDDVRRAQGMHNSPWVNLKRTVW